MPSICFFAFFCQFRASLFCGYSRKIRVSRPYPESPKIWSNALLTKSRESGHCDRRGPATFSLQNSRSAKKEWRARRSLDSKPGDRLEMKAPSFSAYFAVSAVPPVKGSGERKDQGAVRMNDIEASANRVLGRFRFHEFVFSRDHTFFGNASFRAISTMGPTLFDRPVKRCPVNPGLSSGYNRELGDHHQPRRLARNP